MALDRRVVRKNVKIVLTICLICVVGILRPSTAACDVGEPKDTPKYVYLTSAILGGANLVSVFANSAGILNHEPSRTYGYLGVVGGTLSIGFAFKLAQEEPYHESMSIFFGLSGGLALGLGAFNLKLSHHSDEIESTRFRLGPALIQNGSGYVAGIGVSFEF